MAFFTEWELCSTHHLNAEGLDHFGATQREVVKACGHGRHLQLATLAGEHTTLQRAALEVR